MVGGRGPATGVAALRTRLETCRRLIVLCAPGLFPATGLPSPGATIVLEMSRFFEDVLLVDEESGAAAWHGRQGLLQGDAGSLAKRFLTLGADLCLVAGAPCRTPEVAAVVVAAWRAGVRIVELGPAPSELAPLAGERVDGSTEELLEDLWDRFLGDGADHALNKGVDRLGRHTP